MCTGYELIKDMLLSLELVWLPSIGISTQYN